MRALPAIGTVLLLALALCACGAPSPPRTKPDQVETSAVALAEHSDGVTVADGGWAQLWTPTQAGAKIAACVYRGSDGLLVFSQGPLAKSAEGMTHTFRISSDHHSSADGGVGPPFFDSSTLQQLVDRCFASYPVDFRLFSVPEGDRGALYSYNLTVLRRCLLAHGQHVPRIPSRERFENLLRASAPWNAYDLVVVKDRTAWYALADACPALPATIARDALRAEPARRHAGLVASQSRDSAASGAGRHEAGHRWWSSESPR